MCKGNLHTVEFDSHPIDPTWLADEKSVARSRAGFPHVVSNHAEKVEPMRLESLEFGGPWWCWREARSGPNYIKELIRLSTSLGLWLGRLAQACSRYMNMIVLDIGIKVLIMRMSFQILSLRLEYGHQVSAEDIIASCHYDFTESLSNELPIQASATKNIH